MRIKSLHVRNFRSLVSVRLPLHNLNVVIGPNGSGKTALTEVLQLLQRGSQGELGRFFDDRGGYRSVISQNNGHVSAGSLAVQVELAKSEKSDDQIDTYTLELRGTQLGFEVGAESFRTADPTARSQAAFDYSSSAVSSSEGSKHFLSSVGLAELLPTEPLLSQIPAAHQEGLRALPPLKKFLGGVSYYRPIDVTDRSLVRLPQSLTPSRTPGAQAETLFSALYNMRTNDPELYERLAAVIAQAFPSFGQLEFPVVGAGLVTMAWYDKCCRQPFYPNQLSEGTLRFLWLMTLIMTSPSASVLMIDEPETSLHPELVRLVALMLQEAALETQVLVTTHSSDLIGWLQPDEVLIADKENGETHFTWADTLNLDAWLAEYTLRDLWLMGNLGGRP